MRVVWGALAGLLSAAAVAFGISILVLSYGNLPQRDGGKAMTLMFVVTPGAALLGALIGGVAVYLRRR